MLPGAYCSETEICAIDKGGYYKKALWDTLILLYKKLIGNWGGINKINEPKIKQRQSDFYSTENRLVNYFCGKNSYILY